LGWDLAAAREHHHHPAPAAPALAQPTALGERSEERATQMERATALER